MKNLCCIFTLLFLLPYLAWSQTDSTCCKMQLKGKITISSLSNEFNRLKKQRTAYCCQSSGSGLEKVMQMLYDSIKIGTSEKRIMEIMEQPDKTSANNDWDSWGIVIKTGETIMIYPWVEGHHFIYFIIKDGVLNRKSWFYATE